MEKVKDAAEKTNVELKNAELPERDPLTGKLPGHIDYDVRDGIGVYGKYVPDWYEAPTRSGKMGVFHHPIYLGRCIDKSEGIFSKKDLGIYQFTMEKGFVDLAQPEFYVPTLQPKANVRFGHTWVFDEFLKQCGLNRVLDSLPLEKHERDTLYSLVSFKTFAKDWSYRQADTWYVTDYSSFLYPNAVLYSQSISIFLKKIGSNEFNRTFFRSYLELMRVNQSTNTIINANSTYYPLLIDSTGLVNNIDMHYTAPCSHGGPAINQVRLIYVVDYITGLPIYFRYIPGNIVDKLSLIPTINTLKHYQIDINMLIMDAGYYSQDNINEMLSLDIPFIVRVPDNIKIFSEVLKEYGDKIDDNNNLVSFNKRTLYVLKVERQLFGRNCYAYICIDIVKQSLELSSYVEKHNKDIDFLSKLELKKPYFGKFMILSNKDIPSSKIIETYYNRAKIEQIFDTAKNMTGLLPLGVHSEEALKGHLLTSFIASAVYSLISHKLSDKNFYCTDILHELQELRIDMYDNNKHIIHEVTKNQREVIEALGLEYPFHVKVGNNRKAELAKERMNKSRRGRPKGSKGKPKYKQFLGTDVSTNSSTMDMAVKKRGRGRPPGSKNRPKPAVSDHSAGHFDDKKRSRGRPPGSKNRPKPAASDLSLGHLEDKKRSRGRPPGSKNRPKPAVSDLSPGHLEDNKGS
jgi:hypothetical protein